MTPEEKLAFARHWWSKQTCPGCGHPIWLVAEAGEHHRMSGCAKAGQQKVSNPTCAWSRDDLYTIQLIATGVVSVPT